MEKIRNRNRGELLKEIVDEYEKLFSERRDTCEERKELSARYRELTETSTHKIARLLHSKLCRSNHEDQCSWYYEIIHYGLSDNWLDWTHSKYLEKAQRLEAVGFTFEDVNKFFEALDS